MQQAAPAPAAAAAAVAGVAGGDPREEEAPEYPPPPAYYRLFAPPVPTTAAAALGGDGADAEGEEEEGGAAMGGIGGPMGEEEDSFPLPPPALPRRGQRVEVFGFPLAFLDEERYDPIVPPEARLYPFAESVTRDEGVTAGAGTGGESDAPGSGPGVAVVEVDFRKELKRMQALLVDKIPALLLALRTEAIATTSSSPSPAPAAQAGAGAAAAGAGVEPAHVSLLGEVVQAVDNMHDVLSAYRQHQTLVQMVERMEAQCREKRAAIAALKSGIEGGRAAAAGASAGLVVALTALVQQGDVMG